MQWRGTNALRGGDRAAQERAAAAARMLESPDVVPRWHRSKAVIGAGPAGYVYQVCRPDSEERGLVNPWSGSKAHQTEPISITTAPMAAKGREIAACLHFTDAW